jgi:nucleoside-diphosphate-sugar epimerase
MLFLFIWRQITSILFHKFDFLFITATISKEKEVLLDFIEQLKQNLSADCVIVFTSTIGVYSAERGVVDENSWDLKKDSSSYYFEQLLLDSFPDQVIILRLGGLIGEDRHPVFSLSGRNSIPDGQKAVNLVHKEDILCFFQCILQQSVPNGIYNIVYPKHPSRKVYYTEKAKEKNLVIPEFIEGTETGKIVCSEKSRQIAGFDYRFSI